jgi:hypothetical protein
VELPVDTVKLMHSGFLGYPDPVRPFHMVQKFTGSGFLTPLVFGPRH